MPGQPDFHGILVALIARSLPATRDKASLSLVSRATYAASITHGDVWWQHIFAIRSVQLKGLWRWLETRTHQVHCGKLSFDLYNAKPTDIVEFCVKAPAFWPDVTHLCVCGYDNRFCRVDGFSRVRELKLDLDEDPDVFELCAGMLPPALETLCIDGESVYSVRPLCNITLPPSVRKLSLNDVTINARTLATVTSLKCLCLWGVDIDAASINDEARAAWRQMALDSAELEIYGSDSQSVTSVMGYPRVANTLALTVRGGSGDFALDAEMLPLLRTLKAFHLIFEDGSLTLDHTLLFRNNVLHIDSVAYPGLEFKYVKCDY